ncbi:MAG: carboxymuconolactone decarboxylase family protein [Anaerolineales bacterium]
MQTFQRRTYRNLGDFLADFRKIMTRRKEIRTLMGEELIPPAFRERLMLAVTAVYGCRYCSFAHAREALSKGVSQKEIEALGECFFEGSPPEEVPALLYAQHWAEANGKPDITARAQIVERYGERVVDAMELALRMIRMGNLSGNTWDYFLHRISFGRWGAWK